MQGAREEAQSALKKAAADMKKFYDRTRGEAIGYKPGDLVLLEATNLNTDRPMKKLDDKRYGPFEIVEKVGVSAYKLALPKAWKPIFPVFNEVLLTPYRPPQYSSQQNVPERPPPDIIDDQPQYEVEYVKDSRLRCGKLQYLIKWKGYPAQSDWTWEPEENLKNSPEAIKKFHQLYPYALRRINAILRFQPIPEPFTEIRTSHIRWEDGKYQCD